MDSELKHYCLGYLFSGVVFDDRVKEVRDCRFVSLRLRVQMSIG